MLGFNRNGMVPYEGKGSLFDNFFSEPFFAGFPGMAAMKTDIKEDDNAYSLAVEIPGVEKGDIALDYNDEGTLTVAVTHKQEKEERQKGYLCRERGYGRSSRSYYLPGVQRDAISARYENGVLSVTLPKGGEQKRPGIEIQ